MQEIFDALNRLNERCDQLPGLSCSIRLYSDGTGAIYNGLEEELAIFVDPMADVASVVDTIDAIERGFSSDNFDEEDFKEDE